jgi:DNA-binding MarR family transcriptional regulator
MDSLGDTISAQAGLLSELLSETANPVLESYGISRANFEILMAIAGAKQAPQSDIARRLGLAPATLSEALDKLSADDWCLRAPSRRDGRVKMISLTPKGKKLVRDTVKAIQVAEQAASQTVSTQEFDIALRVLKAMNRKLAEIGSAQDLSR